VVEVKTAEAVDNILVGDLGVEAVGGKIPGEE
jgi:hypothetical protein